MSAREVIDKLARGDVFLRPITFPEGLTIQQMAQIYERDGGGSRADFVAAARNAALIRDIDPAAPDLEGYLFPQHLFAATANATAEQLVQRMVTAFRDVLTQEIVQRAAARGLTVRQLMTLASLVEKETAKPEERPLVAAVYTNRLRIGMGMQCDPTVIYALERAGKYTGNLTREDLQFDSPYNTYRYAGLPPGPIAAPGRASIEAASAPADVPYLYFVSRNDGSHVFSDDARRAQSQRLRVPGQAGARTYPSESLIPIPNRSSLSLIPSESCIEPAACRSAGTPIRDSDHSD